MNWIAFWLLQARTPELLQELTRRFPAETRALSNQRLLLNHAVAGEIDALREALDAEVRAEQARDRVYWAPLRAELEAFRRAEQEQS